MVADIGVVDMWVVDLVVVEEKMVILEVVDMVVEY